jgi:Protein of unknown function (DUF3108)
MRLSSITAAGGIVLAALLAAPLAGLAATSPGAAEPQTLRYVATWAGLPAGEVHLQLAEGASAFRAQIDISTVGIPRWLTRFRARGISEGALPADGLATPTRYDAAYDLRSRKGKRISMRFVGNGRDSIVQRGPEDSAEKYLLPTALLTDVVDPLAALARMRDALRTGLAGRGHFSIPVFDGKRRFDVEEHAVTRETREIGDQKLPVLHLSLLLHPIAGFRGDDGEPNPDPKPRGLDVLFSDDGSFTPLRLEVTVAWLSMVVELAQRCGSAAPCKVTFE